MLSQTHIKFKTTNKEHAQVNIVKSINVIFFRLFRSQQYKGIILKFFYAKDLILTIKLVLGRGRNEIILKQKKTV